MSIVTKPRRSGAAGVLGAAAMVGGVAGSATAHAAAIPFTASTFTLNHSTFEDQNSGDIPTVLSTTSLRLTNSGNSDANSSFYTTPVAINAPFTASFVYQATGPTGGMNAANDVFGADGITFVIETTGSTDGTPATGQIGGRGAGLGYGNNDSTSGRPATLPNFIANSTAVELTDYPQTGTTSFLTGIVTAGSTGTAAGNFTAAGSLLFSDPTLVNLVYNGTTLTETLTDQTSGATFALPAVTENLATIVGGSTAFIGFTAGSGGDSAVQTVSNLTFTPTGVPEPTSAALAAAGVTGLLARRRRRSI